MKARTFLDVDYPQEDEEDHDYDPKGDVEVSLVSPKLNITLVDYFVYVYVVTWNLCRK